MTKLNVSHYVYVSSLTALTFVLAVMAGRAREWLRYTTDDVLGGEVWRLFTGHLVHLGWSHWASNVAGLWVIMLLWGQYLRGWHWCYLTAILAGAVSACFLLFEPDLQGYVGFSGILHGLISMGLLLEAKKGQRFAYAVLAGVAAKLGYEQFYGAMPGSEAMIGGNVLVNAHLYGAIAGVVCALLWPRGQDASPSNMQTRSAGE